MPTTRKKTVASRKRTVNPTRTKKSSNRGLRSRLSLNRKTSVIFVAVFAVIGFLIYQFGFAADYRPNGTAVTGVGAYKWGDEFSGTSLDLTKWRPNWLGSSDTEVTKPINSLEAGCYDPRNVSVNNGTLKLRLERVTPTSGCTKRNGSPAAYKSGMVTTEADKADFKEGYYEARIYTPGSASKAYNFPAFWTNGDHGGGCCWARDGEIDIMESLGGELRWHYHWGAEPNNRSVASPDNKPPMFASAGGWHTYGLKREAGKLTFYYDGVAYGTVTSNVVSSPHYVIFNHGLNDDYDQETDITQVPATMEVDYFRYWELGTGTGTPTTPTTPTNNPPTISLGSLNTSYTAPANVTLNATASDSDGVTKVEFFNGSNKLGEDTTSPYSYAWNNIAAGNYSVTARATDTKGATSTTAARTFTVQTPGTSTPTPTNGSPQATFGNVSATYAAPATVPLSVTASDNDGINRVSFYNGDTWLSTDTTAPYTHTMTNLPAGSYSVYASVSDNAGNRITTTPKSFTVTGTSTGTPTADLQAPSVPSGLSRSLELSWFSYYMQLRWNPSTDNTGVKEYTVSVSTPKGIQTIKTPTNSLQYRNLEKDVPYTFSVRAHDVAGNQSVYSSPVTATIGCQWIFCSLK